MREVFVCTRFARASNSTRVLINRAGELLPLLSGGAIAKGLADSFILTNLLVR
jgi:hypothetical protein